MVFSVLEVFELIVEGSYLVGGSFDYAAGNSHFEVIMSWFVKDNQGFYTGFTLENIGNRYNERVKVKENLLKLILGYLLERKETR